MDPISFIVARHSVWRFDFLSCKVIVGPEDEDGPWYFSLNNRRLWVLKRCGEEGLLENSSIRVRVRPPKSESEMERYTLEKCAVEAKFLREKQPGQVQLETTRLESKTNGDLSPPANELHEEAIESLEAAVMKIENDGEGFDTDTGTDESSIDAPPNPFSVLV